MPGVGLRCSRGIDLGRAPCWASHVLRPVALQLRGATLTWVSPALAVRPTPQGSLGDQIKCLFCLNSELPRAGWQLPAHPCAFSQCPAWSLAHNHSNE